MFYIIGVEDQYWPFLKESMYLYFNNVEIMDCKLRDFLHKRIPKEGFLKKIFKMLLSMLTFWYSQK